MTKLIVIDIVGLTGSILGDDTPNLSRLASDGFRAPIAGILPAVTCSAQATMLTGAPPRDHGIVGNGWYFRDLAEVRFWRQSNRLVRRQKVWERLRERRPGFTCAKLFWWYNMYSTADWSVTPRPIYPADGRKLPAISTEPPDLDSALVSELGEFPFFDFWGPRAGLPSSEWIARAARKTIELHDPDLTLVYLPHLDYDFQRHGPNDPRSRQAVRDIDRVAGGLIDFARERGRDVLVVSEYGITEAPGGSVSINRVLRREGLLRVKDTGVVGELLDCGASRAFAVADHQIAHIYVDDSADIPAVKALLEQTEGIDVVLDDAGKRDAGIDHERAGELVAVSARDRWFDYYYWLDDARAPDFARTVDIHRKPGYDPVELFVDPAIPAPLLAAKIAWKLFRKKLGFRTLLDVIPLRPDLVGGSHGRIEDRPEDGAVLISSTDAVDRGRARFEMADVAGVIEALALRDA